MVRKRPKNIMPAVLCVIIAVATLVVQTAVSGLIAVRGVAPVMLVTCAAVSAVYLGASGGTLMGGLCGLMMDALVPDVRVWIYTALLAVLCGIVGDVSAYANRSRMATSFFWSGAVLIAVGLMETLVFGVIRGGGALNCLVTAGIQTVYSLIFVVPFDFMFKGIERRREKE